MSERAYYRMIHSYLRKMLRQGKNRDSYLFGPVPHCHGHDVAYKAAQEAVAATK